MLVVKVFGCYYDWFIVNFCYVYFDVMFVMFKEVGCFVGWMVFEMLYFWVCKNGVDVVLYLFDVC